MILKIRKNNSGNQNQYEEVVENKKYEEKKYINEERGIESTIRKNIYLSKIRLHIYWTRVTFVFSFKCNLNGNFIKIRFD